MWLATIGMRVTIKTERVLQDGGAPEYVYDDRTPWHCAVFVGKRYGSKGYPPKNAAHVRWTLPVTSSSPYLGAEVLGRTDEHRVGRLVEIATPATLQRVEDIIPADRRVTFDAVATAVGWSHDQAYNMMHERQGFHKVCSSWVPLQLTPQHKSQRMGLSLQHLQRYQDEGDDMLSRIVTGDESWVHHYEPET